LIAYSLTVRQTLKGAVLNLKFNRYKRKLGKVLLRTQVLFANSWNIPVTNKIIGIFW